jgi:hypothetical protein
MTGTTVAKRRQAVIGQCNDNGSLPTIFLSGK